MFYISRRGVLFCLVIISTLLFSSCDTIDSNLNGHWHFESDGINYVPFRTLDIADKFGYKNKYNRGVEVPSLEVDRIRMTFQYLDGHESNSLYHYRLIDTKLEITDAGTGNIYYANKNPSCDIASDYVLNMPVKVNFPFSNVIDVPLEQKMSLCFALYIGKEVNGNSDFVLSTRDAIVNDWIVVERAYERCKIKVPEKWRSKIFVNIYADKNLSISQLNSYKSKLETMNFSSIHLMTKVKRNEGVELVNFDISNIDLENEKSISSLLNK